MASYPLIVDDAVDTVRTSFVGTYYDVTDPLLAAKWSKNVWKEFGCSDAMLNSTHAPLISTADVLIIDDLEGEDGS